MASLYLLWIKRFISTCHDVVFISLFMTLYPPTSCCGTCPPFMMWYSPYPPLRMWCSPFPPLRMWSSLYPPLRIWCSPYLPLRMWCSLSLWCSNCKTHRWRNLFLLPNLPDVKTASLLEAWALCSEAVWSLCWRLTLMSLKKTSTPCGARKILLLTEGCQRAKPWEDDVKSEVDPRTVNYVSQKWRVLAVLLEDQNLGPSNHVGSYTVTCNSSSSR